MSCYQASSAACRQLCSCAKSRRERAASSRRPGFFLQLCARGSARGSDLARRAAREATQLTRPSSRPTSCRFPLRRTHLSVVLLSWLDDVDKDLFAFRPSLLGALTYHPAIAPHLPGTSSLCARYALPGTDVRVCSYQPRTSLQVQKGSCRPTRALRDVRY
eukprot:3826963-Rhodomonas_salina.1